MTENKNTEPYPEGFSIVFRAYDLDIFYFLRGEKERLYLQHRFLPDMFRDKDLFPNDIIELKESEHTMMKDKLLLKKEDINDTVMTSACVTKDSFNFLPQKVTTGKKNRKRIEDRENELNELKELRVPEHIVWFPCGLYVKIFVVYNHKTLPLSQFSIKKFLLPAIKNNKVNIRVDFEEIIPKGENRENLGKYHYITTMDYKNERHERICRYRQKKKNEKKEEETEGEDELADGKEKKRRRRRRRRRKKKRINDEVMLNIIARLREIHITKLFLSYYSKKPKRFGERVHLHPNAVTTNIDPKVCELVFEYLRSGKYIGEKVLTDFQKGYFESLLSKIYAPQRGSIIWGPPGTGKTLLLTVVLVLIGIIPISLPVSPASFNRSLVGQSTRLVEIVLNRARLMKWVPCGLIIDEIDDLAPKRTGDKVAEYKIGLINYLLMVLGGARDSDYQNVRVFGTTNRYFDMDDAFLRRIQSKIYVGLLSTEDRKKFFYKLCGIKSTIRKELYNRINVIKEVKEEEEKDKKGLFLLKKDEERIEGKYKEDDFDEINKASKIAIYLSPDNFERLLQYTIGFSGDNCKNLAEKMISRGRTGGWTKEMIEEDVDYICELNLIKLGSYKITDLIGEDVKKYIYLPRFIDLDYDSDSEEEDGEKEGKKDFANALTRFGQDLGFGTPQTEFTGRLLVDLRKDKTHKIVLEMDRDAEIHKNRVSKPRNYTEFIMESKKEAKFRAGISRKQDNFKKSVSLLVDYFTNSLRYDYIKLIDQSSMYREAEYDELGMQKMFHVLIEEAERYTKSLIIIDMNSLIGVGLNEMGKHAPNRKNLMGDVFNVINTKFRFKQNTKRRNSEQPKEKEKKLVFAVVVSSECILENFVETCYWPSDQKDIKRKCKRCKKEFKPRDNKKGSCRKHKKEGIPNGVLRVKSFDKNTCEFKDTKRAFVSEEEIKRLSKWEKKECLIYRCCGQAYTSEGCDDECRHEEEKKDY